MTFATKFYLFHRAIQWFEALTYHNELASPGCARMRCVQTFNSFAFKMYNHIETVMTKMIEAN